MALILDWRRVAARARIRRPDADAPSVADRECHVDRRRCGAGVRLGASTIGCRSRSLAALAARAANAPSTCCSSLPTLVILAAFLLYPLVYGIVLSLHDTQGFDLTAFVGLDHYARAILGDAVFHRSLVNTVLFTGVAVVLQTGLGLFLAVLVADVKRGRTFFQLVFFAPFVLAPVAVGAVWKFLYAPFFGIVPTVGSALGLDTLTVAPLADADTALWAIMAAFLWRFAGFTMVVYLAAIQALPREYYEYAVLEGAGRFQRFRRDHVAAAVAADVRAGAADHPRDPADLRHGLDHDRGRSVARHRDGRDRRLRDRVPLPRGRLRAGDGDDPAGRDPAARRWSSTGSSIDAPRR